MYYYFYDILKKREYFIFIFTDLVTATNEDVLSFTSPSSSYQKLVSNLTDKELFDFIGYENPSPMYKYEL